MHLLMQVCKSFITLPFSIFSVELKVKLGKIFLNFAFKTDELTVYYLTVNDVIYHDLIKLNSIQRSPLLNDLHTKSA